MSNSTGISNTTTTCDPYSAPNFPYQLSCTAPIGPNGNRTAQAAIDVLQSCCPPSSKVAPYGKYGETEVCNSYCNTTSVEEAWEAQWCLGNFTANHPDFYVGGGGGCDTTSGASALGRTSAWGGLVMLSLVVSAAATML